MANSIFVIPTKQLEFTWFDLVNTWKEVIGKHPTTIPIELRYVASNHLVDTDHLFERNKYYFLDLFDTGSIEITFPQNMKEVIEGHETEYLIESDIKHRLSDKQVQSISLAWAKAGYMISVTPKVRDIRYSLSLVIALARLSEGIIEFNFDLQNRVTAGIYEADDLIAFL